jgi:hypothetical protein
MPDDTHIDLRERVAALEQMAAERDAGCNRRARSALDTLPLDGGGLGWG